MKNEKEKLLTQNAYDNNLSALYEKQELLTSLIDLP